jgi:NAD(P)-dependent dehydrogenase (short-subunit alcohol dehydrogenase family)
LLRQAKAAAGKIESRARSFSADFSGDQDQDAAPIPDDALPCEVGEEAKVRIDLSGRTAVVVGASGGLGEAMARALGGAGAHLALVGRNAAKLEALAASLGAGGVVAAPFVADLVDEAQVERLRDAVSSRFPAPQILINSAGTNLRKNLIDFTLDEFRGVLDTSIISTFLACRAFVPAMIGTGYGRIINLASMMAHVSLPQRTAYSTAKSGLLGFTRALALELAAEKITVNAISPGPVATPINTALINDPVASAAFLAGVPLARWGEADEVGGLAAYLCSDLAGFVTGADFAIDGGWTAR